MKTDAELTRLVLEFKPADFTRAIEWVLSIVDEVKSLHLWLRLKGFHYIEVNIGKEHSIITHEGRKIIPNTELMFVLQSYRDIEEVQVDIKPYDAGCMEDFYQYIPTFTKEANIEVEVKDLYGSVAVPKEFWGRKPKEV